MAKQTYQITRTENPEDIIGAWEEQQAQHNKGNHGSYETPCSQKQRHDVTGRYDKATIERAVKEQVESGDFPKADRSKKVYELFGVRKFKDYLIKHNDEPYYHIDSPKSTEHLEAYKDRIKYFEAVHLIGGVGVLALTAPVIFSDVNIWVKLGLVGFNTAVNLATNVYPVMLQRYNRNRINKVIERKQERK